MHLRVRLVSDAHSERDILESLHRTKISANQHAQTKSVTGVARTIRDAREAAASGALQAQQGREFKE